MLKFFGKRSPIYSEELGHVIREVPPLSGQAASNAVFISVPQNDLLPLVNKYIEAMMTEESEQWCRCEWIIHPDDAAVKKGMCRICECDRKAGIHNEVTGSQHYHPFAGIRKRRGNEDPTCPVHTREGMVIYFFEWIFSDAARK